MADEVKLLTAEEIAAMRARMTPDHCDWYYDLGVDLGKDEYTRVVATLERLQAENARLTAERDDLKRRLAMWGSRVRRR